MHDEDREAADPPGDASAGLIHDLASEAPPKGLDTVKAASDAMGADGEQGAEAGRRERIERRAYQLWEAAGRQHGSHQDFWLKAEAEIARKDA